MENKKALRIGLDVDGVLADFDRGIQKWFKQYYVPSETYDSEIVKKHYGKIARFPNFWKSLKPLFDAKEIEFPIHCYITARSIPSEITYNWLMKHGFPDAPVITTGIGKQISKVIPVDDEELDYFIEDNFKTYLELNELSNATCILMNQTYNLKDEAKLRVNNIQELNIFFKNV